MRELNIPKYTGDQLFDIFKLQLQDYGWSVEEKAKELFNSKFTHAGGDTLNIGLKAKIQYAERHWLTGGDKVLLYEDVKKAIDIHFCRRETHPNYYL